MMSGFNDGPGITFSGDNDMNLQEKGYRFLWQDGVFGWVHPACIKEGSVDCTDMPDDEFAEFIEAEKTT